jgi:hypothetical protein
MPQVVLLTEMYGEGDQLADLRKNAETRIFRLSMHLGRFVPRIVLAFPDAPRDNSAHRDDSGNRTSDGHPPEVHAINEECSDVAV